MPLLSRPRSYLWQWVLDAPAAALWPLVAETDRFNRDTGIPPVTDVRTPDEPLAPGRRHLSIRVAGVPIEWQESPFEWVVPTRFGVVRRYRRGPLREMRVRVAIPVQIGWISRRSFGRTFRRYAEEARRAPAAVGSAPATAVPRPAAPSGDGLDALAAARLHALGERLCALGHGPELVARLLAHIEQADQAELSRMRPYVLADAWGAERRATLRLLLHAARVGLLDLRRDVMCPLFRGNKDEVDALKRLPEGAIHCETCRIDFEADLERSVELTFVPAAGIRAPRVGAFCVAGPRTTPHVLVQQLLAPGERRAVRTELGPARYRVRTLDGRQAAAFEVADGGAARLEIRFAPDVILRAEPARVDPAAVLALANESAEEQLVLVDATGGGTDATTAAEVLVLQEFRDLFSREVLAAGRSAGVGTLHDPLHRPQGIDRAVPEPGRRSRLRSGRRALPLAARGDRARARLVGEDDRRRRDGSLSRAGRRGARGAPCARGAAAPPLVLKAGLHTGPCIAVTLNERLDYFGSTVNVAARLAGLSQGCGVVMSDVVRADPGVGEMLAEAGLEPEGFRASLRGIEGDAVLWRVRVPS